MMSARAVPLVLAVAALAVVSILSPRWPRDQSVRIDLGDQSVNVREVAFLYAETKAAAEAEDWAREARFRYPEGAPRIVHHEVRLADGDYVIEIELSTDRGRNVQRRNVHLGGAATTIDLAGVDLSPVEPRPTKPEPTKTDSVTK